MTWRFLVRLDVLGLTGIPWGPNAQRQLRLKPEQIEELESGKVVHTASRGGTELFLMNPPESGTQTKCPMCDGSGHVDWQRIYGSVQTVRKGKLA